jgi:hypothetical protein
MQQGLVEEAVGKASSQVQRPIDATVIISANYLAVGLRSSGLSILTNPQLQYRDF